MKPQTIFELRDIVITALTRFVWYMQSNTQIKTNNQESQIITNTHSRIQGDTLDKILQAKFASRTVFVFPH